MIPVDPIRVVRIESPTREARYVVIDRTTANVPRVSSFLQRYGEGTSKTYAYLLVDVIRWMSYEKMQEDSLAFGDLERYIAAYAKWYYGGRKPPWTLRGRPVSPATIKSMATVCNQYIRHIHPGQPYDAHGTQIPARHEVVNQLLLGHLRPTSTKNRLSDIVPAVTTGRSFRESIRPSLAHDLIEAAANKRDKAIIRWLADGGFRIGELLGLQFGDLHLHENGACYECMDPHVHVCDRFDAPNRARSKGKVPWTVANGLVKGGSIRLVSPEMIHVYFQYVSTERSHQCDSQYVFLSHPKVGPPGPLTADAVRKMLNRVAKRANAVHVYPHLFRHRFATEVIQAAGGDSGVAQLAGGWKSRLTVERIYNHPDLNDPAFLSALNKAWRTSEDSTPE